MSTWGTQQVHRYSEVDMHYSYYWFQMGLSNEFCQISCRGHVLLKSCDYHTSWVARISDRLLFGSVSRSFPEWGVTSHNSLHSPEVRYFTHKCYLAFGWVRNPSHIHECATRSKVPSHFRPSHVSYTRPCNQTFFELITHPRRIAVSSFFGWGS